MIMPRRDGSGPAGAGPMTGWGQGYCSPAGARRGIGVHRGLRGRFRRWGFAANGGGRRGGLGLGRSVGRGFPAFTQDPAAGPDEPVFVAQDETTLGQQLRAIEDHLEQIRARLDASND